MKTKARVVILYQDVKGRVPFSRWLIELKDNKAVAKIDVRIERLRLGNLGNWKPVGEGVAELKIDYGPGYRVYFGQIGSVLVVLLCGGDKRTQDRDIVKAKEFWMDFKERYHGEEK